MPQTLVSAGAAVAAVAVALAGGLSAQANASAGKTWLANAAIHQAPRVVPRKTECAELPSRRSQQKSSLQRHFCVQKQPHWLGSSHLANPAQYSS